MLALVAASAVSILLEDEDSCSELALSVVSVESMLDEELESDRDEV
jgi:hypothetical protein